MEQSSPQSRQEKMFSIIESWQESGLSKKQFCAEQSISQPVFYYWMKKYREQHFQAPEGFIPVCVQNEVPRSNGIVEILYPNGVRLLLPGETDLGVVRSLIGLM